MPETTSREDEAVIYLDIVGNESSSGLTAFQRTKQIALFSVKDKGSKEGVSDIVGWYHT